MVRPPHLPEGRVARAHRCEVRRADDRAPPEVLPALFCLSSEEMQDGPSPRALAPYGDLVLIPAEEVDMLLHPLERDLSIGDPRIETLCRGHLRGVEESERAQTILDDHRDERVV